MQVGPVSYGGAGQGGPTDRSGMRWMGTARGAYGAGGANLGGPAGNLGGISSLSVPMVRSASASCDRNIQCLSSPRPSGPCVMSWQDSTCMSWKEQEMCVMPWQERDMRVMSWEDRVMLVMKRAGDACHVMTRQGRTCHEMSRGCMLSQGRMRDMRAMSWQDRDMLVMKSAGDASYVMAKWGTCMSWNKQEMHVKA